MLRIAVAVLAAALALPASPARADAVAGDCYFAVAQVRGSGLTHRGVLFGHAFDSNGSPVALRCYLTVNGVPVDAEASGSGTGLALAVAPIDVFIRDTDDVDVCTEINGVQLGCEESTESLVPPPVVVGLLCAVTRTIGGMGFDVLGLVRIDTDGFVYVAGARVWSCRESGTVHHRLPPL